MPATAAPKPVKELSRKEIVFGMARVPGTSRVLFGGSDFQVHDVDFAAEKPEPKSLGAHESYVTGLAVAGRKAISGGYDGKLIWWDLDTGAKVRTVDAHAKWIRRVVATPDGSTVASVADDMACRLWDAESGALRRELKGHKEETPHHYPSMLHSCAISPDGKHVATGDKVGHVVVWEIETGKSVASMEAPVLYTWDPTQRRHSIGGIRALAFSPDGGTLAVGGIGTIGNIDHLEGPPRVEFFDWREGKRTNEVTVEGTKGIVEKLIYLPDGGRVLALGGGDDGFVMVLDPRAKAALVNAKAPAHLYDGVPGDTPETFHAVGYHKVVAYELKVDPMPNALLLALALALAGAIEDGPPVPVGVAGVDITPDGPVLLSGYLARNLAESKGVQLPIRAVAMAIGSDEEGPSVLLTVDNLGVPDAMVGELATRLKARAGVARERLAVASSHTHCAPCLPGVAPNIFGKPIPTEKQDRVDRYARGLVDRLERACLEALRDRGPARLAHGRGSVDFAINRRTRGGPVDHSLPALRAVGAGGKLRAVVVGYACHCTTLDPLDNLVSPDWAGEARRAIEADHPGATALVVIGCGADSNPRDRPGPEVARRHGRAIADEVARLLKSGPLAPVRSSPAGTIARVPLPFDTLPTREALQALVGKGGPTGYNASTQLARLDRGEPLPAEVDYVVQTWRFGDDLVMVFLAGEVVVDYALRIKAEYDPARTWTVAYANDAPCYIPSERILREGGYEGGGAMVYYGRPARLAPGVEGRVLGAVRSLVPASFAAKPAPGPDPPAPR